MAWAVDQATLGSGSGTGSAASTAMTTTAAVAAGARIFVGVSWWQATEALASVTCPGLTFTIDKQQQNGNQGVALAWADAPSGLASGSTITANQTLTATFRGITAASLTGGLSGGAGQGAASTTGSSNAHTQNITTTTTNAIVVEACIINASSGSNHTSTSPAIELSDITTAGGEQLTLHYRTTTTAGAYTIAGGWTVSTIWSVAAAGYAEAAAAQVPALVMAPYRA